MGPEVTRRKVYRYDPNYVTHPGAMLEEMMAAANLPRAAWARLLHLDEAALVGLLDGSRPLTEDDAARIARSVIGPPPRLWLNAERLFREGLAAGKEWAR